MSSVVFATFISQATFELLRYTYLMYFVDEPYSMQQISKQTALQLPSRSLW